MKFELKFIGKKTIELSVHTQNGTLTEDIANLKGLVSKDLIQELNDVIYNLETHNENILSNQDL